MTLLATVHIAASLLALGTGASVLLLRKGTRLHRRVGWTYVGSMITLNVSALLVYRLTGSFTPFHAGAIASLLVTAVGVLVLRRKPAPGRVRAHALWLAGSFVGLCGAAAAEITTRLPAVPFWGTVAATSAAVILLGFLLIARFSPAALRPFERR